MQYLVRSKQAFFIAKMRGEKSVSTRQFSDIILELYHIRSKAGGESIRDYVLIEAAVGNDNDVAKALLYLKSKEIKTVDRAGRET